MWFRNWGDGPGTVRHARRSLELSPADDHLGRASAAALMGLASWASGDLEAGHSGYAECMAGLWRAGHIADTFGCAIALADIRRTQGRLGEAMRTYEQALQRASQQGGPVLRGTVHPADAREGTAPRFSPRVGVRIASDSY